LIDIRILILVLHKSIDVLVVLVLKDIKGVCGILIGLNYLILGLLLLLLLLLLQLQLYILI
jgi:hypothetical protein